MAQPQYVHQEYPKCIRTVLGGEIIEAIANDETEELTAKKLVLEHEAKNHASTDDEPTKEALIEKLVTAGIDVDKRWGADRLKSELAKLAG